MVPITLLVVEANNKFRPESQMQFPEDKCTPIMMICDLVITLIALNTGLLGIFAAADVIPNAISYSLIGVGSFIALSWILLVGFIIRENQKVPTRTFYTENDDGTFTITQR